MKYNQRDEVIVELGAQTYYAQVLDNQGLIVNLIIKENTLNGRDFFYDMEYGVSKNMILKKIYDAETDKCLAD